MFKHLKLGRLALAMPLVAAVLLPLAAEASPTCTKAPKSQWISEADMKQKVAQLGYHDIKVFKTTASGCYEIYGIDRDGRKAEVYFNPVDGSVFQANVN